MSGLKKDEGLDAMPQGTVAAKAVLRDKSRLRGGVLPRACSDVRGVEAETRADKLNPVVCWGGEEFKSLFECISWSRGEEKGWGGANLKEGEGLGLPTKHRGKNATGRDND